MIDSIDSCTEECIECNGRIRNDEHERICEDCGLVHDERLDRDVTSASPFRSRSLDILGREKDQSRGSQRDLEPKDGPKRGNVSGRPLGSTISRGDCQSQRWERLRKYDEESLTFDPERYDAEGDDYLSLFQGAGTESGGNCRIRGMTLLAVIDTVSDRLSVDDATTQRARSLVESLDESETVGRPFEATVVTALTLARDERIARQIQRIDTDDETVHGVQNALERTQSPADRFRILNNVDHVANDETALRDDTVLDDETVQRIVERRLVDRAKSVADDHGFVLKTVVENVGWS